ncbi:MAG: hypothetical protein LC808_15915 [Actinobacteria bacterium]|nr:hypothetical protein [Actinomycetota bacterium]
MVKPVDIYVLCGLLANEDEWTYRSLASDLRVPVAGLQRGLARASDAGLYLDSRREVHRAHFEEFALHAIRFLAPAKLGPIVPGVPAAWAAPPVSDVIRTAGEEPPPVWPYARGAVRGQALEPLHHSAAVAVEGHPRLGVLLAILDSLRAGDTRVRSVARDLLVKELRATASLAG